MRSIVTPICWLAIALGTAACGASDATRATLTPAAPAPLPTATPPPEPTFLDGWTHLPIAAPVVSPSPSLGRDLSVMAPGFLTRQQLLTPSPVYLWPGNQEYVNALAYGWQFGDGSYRLVRWAGPFTVTLDGDLAENEIALDRTRAAIAEVTRVTGMAITLGPGGACVISLDRNILVQDDAVGEARLTFSGATITGASVVLVNRQELTGGPAADYSNTLLHEMGHVLGVLHSPSDRDVMRPGGAFNRGGRVQEYQQDESTVMHMMYAHRSAGNFPPDRDPGVVGTSASSPIVRVIRD